MLRARADRISEILRLRGGHNEERFVRRLLERLQQRVGSLVGEHVRFVEDDDLVAPAYRRITHHIAQLTNLVDASIGGGIDLENIQGTSRSDLTAGIALVAKRRCGSLNAI